MFEDVDREQAKIRRKFMRESEREKRRRGHNVN
jgi:hypothetical protein